MLRLVSDGGLLTSDGWADVGLSPLAPRVYAGAVAVGDMVLVFGGGSGVQRSDTGDFVHYADGAVYSLTTGEWTELPVAPIPGRTRPELVSFGSEVFVYGGNLTSPMGPATDAAILDLKDRSWRLAAAPTEESLVIAVGGELLSFGSSGVEEYSASQDVWIPVPAVVPEEMTAPQAAVSASNGDVVIVQGSLSWSFDPDTSGFDVLGEVPIEAVTGAALTNVGVVAWSESEGNLAVLPDGDTQWVLFEGPPLFESREGTTFCIGPTTITVWGGWLNRQVVLLATDTGASIPVTGLVPTDT